MPRLLFRPVFEYVKKKFTPTGQLSKTRSLFEACRLLNPNRINHIDRSNITSLLKRLPSIAKLPNDQCLQLFQGLQAELSTYEALARDCDGSRPIGEWWRANKLQLPTWFSVAKIVALYQPSSAAVERLFSIYQHMFNDEQTLALADYKRAAIMVRFNDLQRAKLRDGTAP